MSLKRAVVLGSIGWMLAPLITRAQMSPEDTVKSFKLAPGLEASVWASEPGMVKPTNMDIDERGRIWVTEAANYRGYHNRPEGDRILILEDTKHSGTCDSYKVFVQDKKLFAPLGICKLGNKLYVAQSPNLLVYTIDASGDHPIGEPLVLFTGFGGVNHDHGVHAGVFGPDGRYYFDCGNEAGHADPGQGLLRHGNGEPIVDVTRSQIGPRSKLWRGKPRPRGVLGYREGMAFSCNLDGSEFEVLGYNFRNCYELCVDSFGTVWQSDNDDDGNQGVRISYLMEGGNFGFTGPNGSSWARDRQTFPGQTLQEAHWHQRWPGVVPNMLNTGAGAPCGILVYEGDLLPQQYRGALIHAEAGQNVVRAYITQPSEHVAKGIMNSDGDESALEKPGAGYKCEPIELVKARDTWFRPCDVCVSPDGAVYIADWYDPGVGGHAEGDTGSKEHNWHLLHGRIYRIAPPGFKPSASKLDLNTTEGQIAALESPNLATRYLGYTKLLGQHEKAVPELKKVFESSPNPRFRARALWLLARTNEGRQFVEQALKDKDTDLRITGVRAARRIKMDMIEVSEQLLDDPSPAVLRELCLAMNFEPDERAIPMLVKLGDKYDGADRWYLEAFGIGATGREAAVLERWTKDHKNNDPKVAEGIAWRLNLKPVARNETAQAAKPAAALAAIQTTKSSTTFLAKDGQPLPPIAELATLRGDSSAGERVFKNLTGSNCIRCHQLGTEGGIVGPPLTVIGQKLNKAQLYESILYPSAAIEMGYETWVVKTKAGEVFTGRKVEDTEDHVTVLDADGKYHDIPTDQVDRKVKQNISLMPEGLCQSMSRQELVDLVEFLSQRK